MYRLPSRSPSGTAGVILLMRPPFPSLGFERRLCVLQRSRRASPRRRPSRNRVACAWCCLKEVENLAAATVVRPVGRTASLLGGLHTPESEMGHARVRCAAEPGAGTVVEAVADAAQERPPALHALRRADFRVETRRGAGRVDEELLVPRERIGFGQKPVGGPLPDVTGHVIESVAIRRERLDRRSAKIAVLFRIAMGKISLKVVALRKFVGERLVA